MLILLSSRQELTVKRGKVSEALKISDLGQSGECDSVVNISVEHNSSLLRTHSGKAFRLTPGQNG